MPDEQSVMLGSYVLSDGDTAPIFSAHGLPIYLYQVHKNSNNKLNFRGQEKYLIPHGWGKMSTTIPNIDIDIKENNFSLNGITQNIEVDCSLRDHPNLSIRQFSSNEDSPDFYFKKVDGKISGIVIDKLNQIYSFTKYGFKKWD